MKNKEILIPTIALFAICLAATLLLSLTNRVTEGRIEAVQQEAADNARMLVSPSASSFREAEGTDKAEVYEALSESGELLGYAVTVDGKSYGGSIKVMTGFDTQGEVTGVQILSIEDTPGLGMNAKKEAFRDQFAGRTAGDLTVSKTASLDTEIQAITGATITSTAVTRCVNEAYQAVFGEKGGQE